ncbi:flippase-like domain-containing protein [Rhodobacteraceae bacterium D3-12]|nr:flippase-like domain-containing protein [Rhodobacteraceae bacterium D3-12]
MVVATTLAWAGVVRVGARCRADRAGRAGAGCAIHHPLRDTLNDLSGRHIMPALVVWSLPVWAFEGACYWAIAQGLPSLTAPLGAWLAMPVGTLSTLLPSSPGHVGTFDYFTQAAMRAAGNPLAPATAFVLITHAMLWLCTTVTGGLCLMLWSVRRGKRSTAGPT